MAHHGLTSRPWLYALAVLVAGPTMAARRRALAYLVGVPWARWRRLPIHVTALTRNQIVPERIAALSGLLRQAIAAHAEERPFRVLEIGAFTGQSTRAWLDVIHASGIDAEVISVDPFAWYATPRDAARQIGLVSASMPTALRLFRHNVAIHPAHARHTHWHCRSDEAFARCRDQGLRADFIFIDGSHYYADVHADISAALLCVAPGGWICGDDLDVQQHDLVALVPDIDAHLAARTDLDFDPFPVPHHPGVTAAVGELLGPVATTAGAWWYRP